MVYAYDNWVQLPTRDIYDTATMLMAVTAARDMYEKGLQEMKDFKKEYGEFMSPFAKDMERYSEMVGGVREAVNRMYAAGIDPLRSAEGRAALSTIINRVNPAEFNMMRTNAQLGFEYLKNVEEAKAKNEFDQGYEDWLLRLSGLGSFNDFSSANGMWNRPGPGRYQDANKMVSPLFEDMKDEYIDSSPDGQFDYSGISRERREAVLAANLGALLNTPLGKYHYELAKKAEAERLGYTPDDQDMSNIYSNYLLDASNRFEHRNRTENKEWARKRESQLRMAEDTHRKNNEAALYKQKKAVDYDYQTLDLMDTNRDKKISEEERKSYTTYGSSSDKEPSILVDSAKNPGVAMQYTPSDPYKAKVAPIDGRVKFVLESKKGEGDLYYEIPNDVAPQVLYRYENGLVTPMNIAEMQEDKAWYDFWSDDEDSVEWIPSGEVITFVDKDNKKHQFAFGTISATGETCLMAVQPNKHYYNK